MIAEAIAETVVSAIAQADDVPSVHNESHSGSGITSTETMNSLMVPVDSKTPDVEHDDRERSRRQFTLASLNTPGTSGTRTATKVHHFEVQSLPNVKGFKYCVSPTSGSYNTMLAQERASGIWSSLPDLPLPVKYWLLAW